MTYDYSFEVLEIHDTIATLGICGMAAVYRADSPEKPWFETDYCGRQFLIRRDGAWVISAAADRPLGE